MAIIATLDVILNAVTGKFDKGMTGAQKKTKAFSKSVGRSSSAVSASTRSLVKFAATALTLTAAVRVFRNIVTEMDALGKTSDKLGIATEKLTALQHAGKITGVEVRTLNMGLQRMIRRVSEAAAGTGEAQSAIKELGLSATALARATPDEQFKLIADAMGRIPGEADRVRLSFKIFDSEGVALKNTLALGSDGLERMEADANRLGITVGRDLVRSFEKFTDATTRMSAQFKGLVIPTLGEFASGLADLMDELSGRRAADDARLAMDTQPTESALQRGRYKDAQENLAKQRARLAEASKLMPSGRFVSLPSRRTFLQNRVKEAEKVERDLAIALKLRDPRQGAMAAVTQEAAVGAGVKAGGAIAKATGALATKFAEALGAANFKPAANLLKKYELTTKTMGRTAPGLFSGVAASDKAREIQGAKMFEPLKAVNIDIKAAVEAGVGIWENIERILDTKLAAVEGVK